MEMVSVTVAADADSRSSSSSHEETKPFFLNRSSSSTTLPNSTPPYRSSSSGNQLWRFTRYTQKKFKRKNIIFLLAGFCLGLLFFKVLIRSETGYVNSPQNGAEIINKSRLNFFVIGDWGRRGLYNQSQVAIQMGRIGEEFRPEFVISTGDNFYPSGLQGIKDSNYEASFTNVYTAPSLQRPWYAVLGNHDYMGDVRSQLDYDLVRRDSRWYCRREFELQRSLCENTDSCSDFVDFFLIDTNPFVDEYFEPNPKHTFDWRGLTNRQNQLETQLKNLDNKLRNSTATWKVVVGHHTIRSVGHHGDTKELVERLLPILDRHKVDLYLNGHDHNLQHVKRTDSSIHFFTSGGGSKAFKGLRPYGNEAGVQFVFDGQGFLAVSMSKKQVSLIFYGVFGEVMYNYVLKK